MQLEEPRCFKRKCVHYLGVKEFVEGDSLSQNHICNAFLSGIPVIISYGEELHLKPLKNQGNDIVYQKEEV